MHRTEKAIPSWLCFFERDQGEGSLNRDSACCSVSTDIRGSPFLRHLLVTEKETGKDGDRSCYVLAGCSTLPPTHSTYCKLGDKRERCCHRAIRFVDTVAVYQRRMYRRNRSGTSLPFSSVVPLGVALTKYGRIGLDRAQTIFISTSSQLEVSNCPPRRTSSPASLTRSDRELVPPSPSAGESADRENAAAV
nr:hypothetical protein Iba_chr13dCG6030 [Ipomoea batatas]